jgi:hypothetical protein
MESLTLMRSFSLLLRNGYEPGGCDIALPNLNLHLRLCTSYTSTTHVPNSQQLISIKFLPARPRWLAGISSS